MNTVIQAPIYGQPGETYRSHSYTKSTPKISALSERHLILC
jgi:hypothetical protein